MIDLFYFNGLPVAVLGLGVSGLAAAKALQRAGAEVSAWDDNPDKRARAEADGVPIVDLATCDWTQHTSLVISPGIPHDRPEPHPVAALAKQHGCEVIGDIELLARAQRGASYVGVTGTNGKSTTTALIGHVLELSSRAVQTGGNIGVPVLEFEPLEAGGIYVLELSSYQLETIVSITYDVAVLLNVSADHLDRHGGFDGYVKAKRLVFHRQTKPRSAVIGVDDETCRGIWQELAAADDQTVIPISGTTAVAGGVYVRNGTLIDDTDGQATAVLDLNEVASLPGVHNWQNAAAAYAACKALSVDPPVIAACLRSFPGLAHRQELIAVIDGIAYVNDSKATNGDAAAKALACYGAIYWIAGGQAKETGLEGLEAFYGKIAHAFLIGEAEAAFAQALDGQVAHSRCGDLTQALDAARKHALAEAKPEAVVLLSPACASFDQYENFEARGEAFRHLVEALPGERSDLETAPGAPSGGLRQ